MQTCQSARFRLSWAVDRLSLAASDTMKREAYRTGGNIQWLCGLLLMGGLMRDSAQAQNADLSLSFSDAPAAASLGQYFRFTVSIFNNGPDGATNVGITDTG